jgi:type I restriction enzyme M protein
MIRLHREEPNIFVEIPRIPKNGETLKYILTEGWTIKWLEENNELKHGKTTLKKILLDLGELVLGNAGVDPFEEVYAKLYDERKGINSPSYQLEFFVGDRNLQQVKKAIANLLEGTKIELHGVFERKDKIELRNDHLKACVSFLETKSDLRGRLLRFSNNLNRVKASFCSLFKLAEILRYGGEKNARK